MSRFVVDRDVTVPMADGLELAMDIYRLDGPGPWPVLLQRVPYDKARSAIVNGSIDVRRALDRGYAVCVQDVRGRFASPGTFTPFVDEGPDGADTVAWLHDQPWTTGPIGMIGRSYSAAVQWRAAAELARRGQIALLGALSPGMGGWDAPRQWLVRDGVFQLGFIAWWAALHLGAPDLARQPETAPFAMAAARGIDGVYRDVAPPSTDGRQASTAYFAEWLDLARAVRQGAPALADAFAGVPAEIPAFHTAGWFDVFVDGSMLAFETLAAQAPDRHRLVVGPWAHGGAMGGTFAERSFGLEASGDSIDLTGMQLDWFDRWLRAPATSAPDRAAVTSFVTGPDRWVDLASWPPPQGEPARLFPAADGAGLATEAGTGEAVWSFGYDPADPTPTLGGCTFLPGLEIAANAGPRDQRSLLERHDVVAWTSAPLRRELRAAGGATLRTAVRVPVRSSVLVATLTEVYDDGRAEFIAQGACRFAGGDEPVDVTVRLGPTHHHFAAGRRICLLVAAASYPALDRLAATGGEETPVRIELGAGTTTVLEIPTEAADHRAAEHREGGRP